MLPLIQKGLARIDKLKQEQETLKRYNDEIKRNENFKYTVIELRQIQVPLKPGEAVTNCLLCHTTCHFPCTCGIASDADKRRCAVMDASGNCNVCPQKCSWQSHISTPYHYKIEEVKVEKTYDALKAKYESALQRKSVVETVITGIEKEMQQLNDDVYNMIEEARLCLLRLQEIALKPNPTTEVECIDLLIKSEKQEETPGFMERVKALEEVRKQAVLLSKVAKIDTKRGWREMFGLLS